MERFGWTFAPGDKVMQTVNDYRKDVYNGDTGTVTDVNTDDEQLTARFHGAEHVYAVGELDDLVLAHAATVHKSQGSECPAVVVPVLTQHYTMPQRNLLYTAVTRGKKARRAGRPEEGVAIAVRNVTGRRRWSKLKELLKESASRQAEQTRSGTATPPQPPRAARTDLLKIPAPPEPFTETHREEPGCPEHPPRTTPPS